MVILIKTLSFSCLKPFQTVCSVVPWSISCFNSVWMEQTQGPSPTDSSFWLPSNLFSSCNLGNQPLSCFSGMSTHHFFKLNFLLLINHELPGSSELFQRGGSLRRPPEHASAGLLHLPLSGLLFQPWQQGYGRVWTTFSANWPRRSARAWRVSWKCKTSSVASLSSRTCRSHIKMSGVKPRMV